MEKLLEDEKNDAENDCILYELNSTTGLYSIDFLPLYIKKSSFTNNPKYESFK